MIYFTADTHFGHKNIIQYCSGRQRYECVEDMNEDLINRWNRVVTPDDTICHLGDVAFLPKDKTLEICHRLNGHKILIMGNHDLHRTVAFWGECGFEEVHKLGYGQTLERFGFSLCHYPNRESLTEYDEREYLYQHAPHKLEGWLLHGHVHERWWVNGSQINVGVDVWDYKPVSLDVMKDIRK